MISLRLRTFGAVDWTLIYIEGDLEAETLSIIGSGLDTSDLHVQIRQNDGTWENLT